MLQFVLEAKMNSKGITMNVYKKRYDFSRGYFSGTPCITGVYHHLEKFRRKNTLKLTVLFLFEAFKVLRKIIVLMIYLVDLCFQHYKFPLEANLCITKENGEARQTNRLCNISINLNNFPLCIRKSKWK